MFINTPFLYRYCQVLSTFQVSDCRNLFTFKRDWKCVARALIFFLLHVKVAWFLVVLWYCSVLQFINNMLFESFVFSILVIVCCYGHRNILNATDSNDSVLWMIHNFITDTLVRWVLNCICKLTVFVWIIKLWKSLDCVTCMIYQFSFLLSSLWRLGFKLELEQFWIHCKTERIFIDAVVAC